MRVAVLTVSDAGSRGEREDRSGPAIVAWARELGYDVVSHELVPDEVKAYSDEEALACSLENPESCEACQ